MKKSERIEKLQEAQDALREALDLIKEATDGSAAERLADAYTVGHLAMLIDEDHGYLGKNFGNIEALIDCIEENDTDTDSDADDDDEDYDDDDEIEAQIVPPTDPATFDREALKIVLVEGLETIPSIKRYRELTGFGLKESIDAVKWGQLHRDELK